MKIVILSPQYFPILGGVPVVANLVGRGLKQLGHDVSIITETPAGGEEAHDDLPVERQLSLAARLRRIWNADLVVSVGVSVKSSWPAVIFRKRHIVSHQAGGVESRLKRIFLRSATNVACSRWLASQLSFLNAQSVPNAFDDEIFFEDPDVPAEYDFVFVGRVVESKGVFTLLNAMKTVVASVPDSTLTIIGEGLGLDDVKAIVKAEGLEKNVRLLGRMNHHEIAKECRKHRYGIVPSQWEEPFGIVALELAACGLQVLAARSGGLPQAVGPCGAIFEKGNAEQLSDLMLKHLSDNNGLNALARKERAAHIRSHTPKAIAAAYLDALRAADTPVAQTHSDQG